MHTTRVMQKLYMRRARCIDSSVHAMQKAVTENGKEYSVRAVPLRTFLHDVAAAVPICAVLPPSIWPDLKVLTKARKFASACVSNHFRVRCLDLMCGLLAQADHQVTLHSGDVLFE